MKLAVVCLVLIFALTGCGGSSSDPAVDNNERMIGNSEVYERIASMTSCTELQREFDIAYDNVEAREPGDPLREISQSYGDAAHNRMQEVGCY